MYKDLLATAAIFLTFLMYVPYVRSIYGGWTKPHVLSWMVWSMSSIIVFLAQIAADGGVGAWPIGVSGLIAAFIAVLSYRRRTDTSITSADWPFLVVAVAAIPIWLTTSNPLTAVVLLTGIELAGFGPTFRLAFRNPYNEHIGFFFLGAARNLMAIGALEAYSWTTLLFPTAKVIACAVLVATVVYWRTRLRARRAA